MKHLLTLLTLALLHLATPAQELWLTDFDEACQQAAAQGKHILVAGLALDQSNSKHFHDRVLQDKGFAPELSDSFILVLLNLPIDSAERAKIQRASEHQKFYNRFNIGRLTPEILLQSPEGSAYARYRPTEAAKPDDTLAVIEKLRKNQFPKLQQTAAVIAEWDAADDETRWLRWDKIAKLYRDKTDDPLHLQYETAVRTGIESDPANARGRKPRGAT
jgi:hypothetical protein